MLVDLYPFPFPFTLLNRSGRENKIEMLVGWGQVSLIRKAKATYTHIQSKIKNLFTTSHQQAGVCQFPEKQGLSTHSRRLKIQALPPWMLPLPPFPQLQLLSMTLHSMGYSLVRWGQLLWLCPNLPTAYWPLSVRGAGGRNIWYYVNTVQQWQKQQHIVITVSSHTCEVRHYVDCYDEN